MQIGGTSFGFMLPVLAGYIAMSIADRPGLVAGFVGGLLANQGGSGFLGALIAGFAAGYLVLLVKKLVSGLPQALEGTKPVLFYPVLGVLFIGLAITFVINPPVSALNHWLMDSLQSMGTTSRVLLGLIFGAMMSVDMGGPVNKAAYVIGTGALATGEYGIMAAVMAGGMVLRWQSLFVLHSSLAASQKQNANLVLQTILWAFPSSQKVLSHLQRLIQFAYCQLASSVLVQLVRCPCSSNVHYALHTAVSS